jgi:hypothetical protein
VHDRNKCGGSIWDRAAGFAEPQCEDKSAATRKTKVR